MQLILTALAVVLTSEMPWDPGVRALQAGHPAEAVAEFQRACPSFAPASGEYGYCQLMLGMAQQGSGRIDDARESFRNSLVPLKAGGPLFKEALAMSYRYLGELGGEEDMLKQALALQVSFEDPLPAAATRRRLADLLCRNGRLDEAEVYLEQAKTAFTSTDEALAVERIELIATQARIHLSKGNARAARELFFQVLRASESYFGTTHPRTAQANLDLAAALRAEGESARAIPLIRKANWIQSRVDARKSQEPRFR